MGYYAVNVTIWAFFLIMMPYTWIKKRKDWSLAFLVGLLFQTPIVFTFTIMF